MNKFHQHLDDIIEVKTKLLEYMVSVGYNCDPKQFIVLDFALIVYKKYPDGLTWNQMRDILDIEKISKLQNPPIADITAKQRVNRKIEMLVKYGFANKISDPVDKRKIRVQWTDKTTNIYNALTKAFE